MNRLEKEIDALGIENRFDAVMNKIGLSGTRERISVQEASGKAVARVKDVQRASERNVKLEK